VSEAKELIESVSTMGSSLEQELRVERAERRATPRARGRMFMGAVY